MINRGKLSGYTFCKCMQHLLYVCQDVKDSSEIVTVPSDSFVVIQVYFGVKIFYLRLFLSMDPKFGEISRAMRNRGIEICIPNEVSQKIRNKDVFIFCISSCTTRNV